MAKLSMITVHVDGESYRILDKKYYDHIEWAYPKDEDGFLIINAREFAEWIKSNSTKIGSSEEVSEAA